MLTKPTEKEREIAFFKGYFISQFLFVEFYIEQIIILFFTDSYKRRSLGDAVANIRANRNYERAQFFEHNLFVDPFFGFRQKVNSFKTIIQLLDGNFYYSLTKNTQYNLITLIERMGEFRNLIAHNFSFPDEKGISAIKKSAGKLKAQQTRNINDEGKTVVSDEYYFTPKVDTLIITDEIKGDIYAQLTALRIFLITYYNEDKLLSNGNKDVPHHEEYLKRINTLTSLKEVNSRLGIFLLTNINNESPKNKKPKKETE